MPRQSNKAQVAADLAIAEALLLASREANDAWNNNALDATPTETSAAAAANFQTPKRALPPSNTHSTDFEATTTLMGMDFAENNGHATLTSASSARSIRYINRSNGKTRQVITASTEANGFAAQEDTNVANKEELEVYVAPQKASNGMLAMVCSGIFYGVVLTVVHYSNQRKVSRASFPTTTNFVLTGPASVELKPSFPTPNSKAGPIL